MSASQEKETFNKQEMKDITNQYVNMITDLERKLETATEALKKIGTDKNVSSCWNCDEAYEDGPKHLPRCGKHIAGKALNQIKGGEKGE